MKIALSIICKASDSEAEVLAKCLASFGPVVDKVFLTITGENQKCEEVGKLFNAEISHFEWCNDFSKARNFALSQIPKEYDYWMWADADDAGEGLENLRKTIEEHPETDAFIFNYLYGFDEWKNPVVVHMKTRVLRNDGCVEWRGRLHEDFHNFRELNAKFVEGIQWIHNTNGERADGSAQRNVEIAKEMAEAEPNDPRSYWNLGNALKAAGQDKEALETFNLFLNRTQSEEEKYVALCRVAEIYVNIKDNFKALDTIRLAIGIRPTYPDAYITCAKILCQLKRFQDAKEQVMMSLQLEPPYRKIIVFNPRDYDLEPLKLLAHIYMNLDLPQLALEALKACEQIVPKDEKLKGLIAMIEKEAEKSDKIIELVSKLKDADDETILKEIEGLDPDYRSHPAICNLRNTRLIKKESSGKDVVFYCGFTEDQWHPEIAAKRGIGGSEEAVIHITKRLAKAGYNVTVYNNCGYKTLLFDGVTYKPFWEWNYRDKQDVVVLWRSPKALEYEINADKIFLDLHDVIPDGEFTEKRLARLTKVFVKSQAHKILFPSIPEDKFVVVQNGIEWDKFQTGEERDPFLILNTSSPDRSLKTLLNAFKEVKKRVPEAKLKWAYGWGVWDSVFSGENVREAWKTEVTGLGNSIEGFEALGRIGHEEIAKLYQKASVFAYPTAFYEIDCISARKAQAAGAVPVVTDFAALDETVQYGTKIKVDKEKENWGKPYQFDFGLQDDRAVQEWIDACVQELTNRRDEAYIKEMRDWTKKFDWEAIADTWIKQM